MVVHPHTVTFMIHGALHRTYFSIFLKHTLNTFSSARGDSNGDVRCYVTGWVCGVGVGLLALWGVCMVGGVAGGMSNSCVAGYWGMWDSRVALACRTRGPPRKQVQVPARTPAYVFHVFHFQRVVMTSCRIFLITI